MNTVEGDNPSSYQRRAALRQVRNDRNRRQGRRTSQVHQPHPRRHPAHRVARHANRSFGKSKVSIVERLVNNLMRTEVYTGKKAKSMSV